MQACQIIFFGKALSKRIPALVADLQNAPVLTVGETAGFLGAGGMICFLLEENKVRFEINLDAAESAKLKIGSRLLILAQNVVGESQGSKSMGFRDLPIRRKLALLILNCQCFCSRSGLSGICHLRAAEFSRQYRQ